MSAFKSLISLTFATVIYTHLNMLKLFYITLYRVYTWEDDGEKAHIEIRYF